jgi:hypothetical protein
MRGGGAVAGARKAETVVEQGIQQADSASICNGSHGGQRGELLAFKAGSQ